MIDPITLEVMWNRLIAVVNEQATALMRTSFTTIVRESGDLSAGVFDTRGNMIAQAVTGTPGHINAMATCIHHFLAEYPADTLQPGVLASIEVSTGEVLGRKGMREFPAGTHLTLRLPGGGGFGNPVERDVLLVLDDVANGLVSIDEAWSAYGVAIDPVTMMVDPVATKAERSRRIASVS